MMAVGLAIGGDMHQLRPRPHVLREAGHDSLGKSFSVAQEIFEGHRARNRAIVEEQVDFPTRWQGQLVGHRWIDALAADVLPGAAADFGFPAGLPGSQDREFDASLGQYLQGFQIRSRFRKPHAFREPAEAKLEVADTPCHLRLFVTAIGQGHDDVVIRLSESRAMAGEALLAGTVGLEKGGVHPRGLRLHPGKQRGTEVKADFFVVVQDANNPAFVVQDAGGGVGSITFRRNALVPVVIGVGGVLEFDRFQPGIFPRRLVKMAMNTHISHTLLSSAGEFFTLLQKRLEREIAVEVSDQWRKAINRKGRGENSAGTIRTAYESTEPSRLKKKPG